MTERRSEIDWPTTDLDFILWRHIVDIDFGVI
jgi:hypothetical protein